MRSWVLISLVLLCACDQMPMASEHTYTLEEDGAPERDMTTYESLGHKSVNIKQKYAIKLASPEKAANHYVIVNVTQFYGNKKDQQNKGASIFIDDGRGEFECSKFVSEVSLSTSEDDVPELRCEVDVQGYMPISQATMLTDEKKGA